MSAHDTLTAISLDCVYASAEYLYAVRDARVGTDPLISIREWLACHFSPVGRRAPQRSRSLITLSTLASLTRGLK